MRVAELAARSQAASRGIGGAGTEEIGWLLGLSSRAAAHLVGTCEDLVSRPLVFDGLHQGLIDRTRALKIVHLLAEVPDPARERLEARAIAYGAEHTTAQLHRYLLRLTCDHDPDETLRKQALDNRGVALIPRGHGMTSICIDISAEHADAFIQGLDHYANTHHPDPYDQGPNRSLEQRRADALVGLITDRTTWDVHVAISIPADMLMGVETAGADLNGSPVTHALALHLAWSPDARWTRLVTDPLTGILLDPGSTRYEIPKKLRHAIRAARPHLPLARLHPQGRIHRHRPRHPPPTVRAHQRRRARLPLPVPPPPQDLRTLEDPHQVHLRPRPAHHRPPGHHPHHQTPTAPTTRLNRRAAMAHWCAR